ncbi:hypothetical protein [Helicobacter bilis]|nr:hypothetical protein [Helicobacter bilis]MDD7295743.1 hypothetical protein [Helicobacter bilis]MDY4400368.1 hypothetical protein [Helicobacter bilis]
MWYYPMRYITPLITIIILLAKIAEFFMGEDAVKSIIESMGL